MSDSGYTEIDLDTLPKTAADTQIEIVEEPAEQEESVFITEELAKPEPAARQEDEDEDDDSGDEGAETSKKKITRTQRLKAQRDKFAQELSATKARLAELEAKSTKHEADAQEGAAVALDLYINNLDAQMKSLRSDYDKAFDAGDRDALFQVSKTMAELAAEKKAAERDKRAIPIRAAKPTGQEAQPPTHRTTDTDRGSQPAPTEVNPLVQGWFKRNQTWFNKDATMTAVARTINNQLLQEGYDDTDPDFYSTLDARLREELPHKFAQAKPTGAAGNSPTIQNRGMPMPTNGKLKVRITQEDRSMAESLGLSIEAYARQKARRELARENSNGYTEVL